MTNEEAIKGLKTIRTVHNGNYAEHIDMAIKVLEQQPSEDSEDKYDIGYNCGYADAMCDIAESEEEG